MKDAELSREELEELVAHLREENARLRMKFVASRESVTRFPALPVKPSRIARTVLPVRYAGPTK